MIGAGDLRSLPVGGRERAIAALPRGQELPNAETREEWKAKHGRKKHGPGIDWYNGNGGSKN